MSNSLEIIGSGTSSLRIILHDESDSVTVYKQKFILAVKKFKGGKRIDNFNDNILRTKNLFNSTFSGKLELFLGAYDYKTIQVYDFVEDDDVLVFNPEHLLFATDGISLSIKTNGISNSIYLKDPFKKLLKGKGTIGICSAGEIVEVESTPESKMLVSKEFIVAYSSTLNVKAGVTGNILARANSDWYYEFTGIGKVLLNTRIQSSSAQKEDGVFKRGIKQIPGAWLVVK